MKRGYLLIATIAILAICSVFVFAACSGDIELEEHGIVVTIDDFAYNGNIATATINAGNDSYELEWFSVSEAGDLTKLDSSLFGFVRIMANMF